MKKTKKAFKSSICGGYKGKVVIQKTNLSLRKALASNMAAARAVLKGGTRQCSPISATPPPIVTSVSSDGVSFNEFIEGNGLDWRKFGCITYDEMKSSGYYDLLMKRIKDYSKARSNKAKHQLVLSSSELPLTDTSSMNLHSKIRVYAFWPFYGRFDGSPDSAAIASTVKITSSTQGTAGAPAVDFFDGR